MTSDARVWAAVVCYRGNREQIQRLIEHVLPQVERVLIIDNAAQDSGLADMELQRCEYVPMPINLGTAGAMNQAWEKAVEHHVDFLVCFDQDSEVPADFVSALARQFDELRKAGQNPGAVGPVWEDARTRQALRPMTPAGWRRPRADPNAAPAVEVDHLITSGCLVHRHAWHTTGPFDERLFLDYVDIEWSLRARSRGLKLFVTREARMIHSIGDSVITLWGRSLWVHRPQRQYLLVRNHILLWSRSYIAMSWKCRDALQVLMKIMFLLLLRSPRMERVRWVLRGLSDGLAGRSGPIM